MIPGATAPIYTNALFEHMYQLFPSEEHLIDPEEHPEDGEEVDIVDVVLDVLVFLALLVAVGVVVDTVVPGVLFDCEFPTAQTIAPFTHFVPDETAPILINAPLTQTDQLRLSDEH